MAGIFTPRAFVDYRRIPWLMVGTAVLLGLIGVYFIASAHSFALARRQTLFLAAGLAAMLVGSRLDLEALAANAFALYAAGLLSLVLLPFLGIRVNNAVRWYDLGVFKLQPSEFVKLFMVLLLAEQLRYHKGIERFGALLPPLAFTMCPMALIVIQPDLGTSLLFLPLFGCMAFVAGARVRHLVAIAVVLIALALGAWFAPGVIKEYQRQRVLAFLDPDAYANTPAGYNSRQAVLAITAGGLTGQGWGEGVLNRLGRIPERHTDFIFSVVAEEWGFLRTAGLILLYMVLLLSLFLITMAAREPFGRLVGAGILCLVATQTFLHMAISLRMAPITGLTLPLVSYGGSSLVMMFLTLGLAANVAMSKPIVFASEELRE